MENKVLITLAASSFLMLLAAQFLPLLYLIALVPIFLIKEVNDSPKWVFILGGIILIHLAIRLLLVQINPVGALVYAMLLVLVLLINQITHKPLRGAMRTVIIAAFWLGAEYIILKVNPIWSTAFLFKPLEGALTSWTGSTGFLGISLWAVLSNTLMAKALASPSATYYAKPSISVIIATIMIAIPAILSLVAPFEITINFQEMLSLYVNETAENEQYAARGEWLARTCAWLAVMVTIYGFVKLKTTKY